MSVKAMAKVWDYVGLTSTEKLVLLAYADHAGHDGEHIYPAVETVAEKTALNRRTVQRITRALEDAGVLIADGKGKKGTRQWRLNMQWEGGGTVPGAALSTKGGGTEYQRGRHRTARTVLNHHITIKEELAAPFNVFVLWCEVMGYEPSRVTPTKKATECKYGKELLDVEWTLQEIKGCLEELKAQDYWQGKPLSLVHVAKEINEWKHRQTTARTMTI